MHKTMGNADKSKVDWGKVIQVVISILTIIAGAIFESCTHTIGSVRAMLF